MTTPVAWLKSAFACAVFVFLSHILGQACDEVKHSINREVEMRGEINERREVERRSVMTDVELWMGGMLIGTARTSDLSTKGFTGSSYAKFRVGQTVQIGIGGAGNIPATVVRRIQNRFAVQFETPIDLKKVGLFSDLPTDCLDSDTLKDDIGSWT